MFKVMQFETRGLGWWRTQRSKIDMSPDYQRKGRLWSKTDKSFLIDSVLNHYDVPKIYIADFTFGDSKLNKKKMSYAIIDGKQRLETFFDFYDGRTTLDEEFVYLENPSLKLGGMGYSDLRKNYPEIADDYDNFHIAVVHVITDDEARINELFVRLNRSKPLTGAEVRNAMLGPLPKITRLLVDHDFIQTCIGFPISRAQDKNAVQKILLFEYFEDLKETKRKNLDDFARMLSKGDEDKIELASRRALDNLDRMSEIFLPRDILLRSAGLLPVYYWFIRQQEMKYDLYIREFLLVVDRRRKEFKNRERDEFIPTHGLESIFIDFERYNRSTNDIKSHSGRYKILTNFFPDFIKQKNENHN